MNKLPINTTFSPIKIWKNLWNIKYRLLLVTKFFTVKENRSAGNFLLINLFNLNNSLLSLRFRTQSKAPPNLSLKFTKRRQYQGIKWNLRNTKKKNKKETSLKSKLQPQSNFILEKQTPNTFQTKTNMKPTKIDKWLLHEWGFHLMLQTQNFILFVLQICMHWSFGSLSFWETVVFSLFKITKMGFKVIQRID